MNSDVTPVKTPSRKHDRIAATVAKHFESEVHTYVPPFAWKRFERALLRESLTRHEGGRPFPRVYSPATPLPSGEVACRPPFRSQEVVAWVRLACSRGHRKTRGALVHFAVKRLHRTCTSVPSDTCMYTRYSSRDAKGFTRVPTAESCVAATL